MSCPERETAEALLRDAEACNPGPWGNHSRVAAYCAETIAAAAGLNPEKAYVLGLLHDIGRKFGITHLAHVWDGYQYMKTLGYDEAARICLTHSFNLPVLDLYIGKRDIPEQVQEQLRRLLKSTEYDDYDRLIQLCDCLAGPEGIVDMEARMEDVRRRYGSYPEEKRRSNRALRRYFEEKCGCDIYELLGRKKHDYPDWRGIPYGKNDACPAAAGKVPLALSFHRSSENGPDSQWKYRFDGV